MRLSTSPSARARLKPRLSSSLASSAALLPTATWSGPTSSSPISSRPTSARRCSKASPAPATPMSPSIPQNWVTITDGMAAGHPARRLPHRRLGAPRRHRLRRQDRNRPGDEPRGSGQDQQGPCHRPNVWFVGVTPRRNPELVVAVSGRTASSATTRPASARKVVAAYVDKQRRLAHNLSAQRHLRPRCPGRDGCRLVARPASDGKLQPAPGWQLPLQDGKIVAEAAPHVSSSRASRPQPPAGRRRPAYRPHSTRRGSARYAL